MAKATSTSESSLSSILANALVGAVGVNTAVSENFVKPTVRQRVAKAFTERARKEAGTPGLWGAAAKSIEVQIDKSDRVTVGAVGSPDDIALAESLEYGSPYSPPRAVMRTYEATFNEEYKVLRDRNGL